MQWADGVEYFDSRDAFRSSQEEANDVMKAHMVWPLSATHKQGHGYYMKRCICNTIPFVLLYAALLQVSITMSKAVILFC